MFVLRSLNEGQEKKELLLFKNKKSYDLYAQR